MRKGPKWEERQEAIQRMVDAGMTDREIGQEFDKSGGTICQVRKMLGIVSQFSPKHKRRAASPPPAEPPPPLVGIPYVDENGLTVTRYPERYAGNLPPRVTARPRRG